MNVRSGPLIVVWLHPSQWPWPPPFRFVDVRREVTVVRSVTGTTGAGPSAIWWLALAVALLAPVVVLTIVMLRRRAARVRSAVTDGRSGRH